MMGKMVCFGFSAGSLLIPWRGAGVGFISYVIRTQIVALNLYKTLAYLYIRRIGPLFSIGQLFDLLDWSLRLFTFYFTCDICEALCGKILTSNMVLIEP